MSDNYQLSQYFATHRSVGNGNINCTLVYHHWQYSHIAKSKSSLTCFIFVVSSDSLATPLHATIVCAVGIMPIAGLARDSIKTININTTIFLCPQFYYNIPLPPGTTCSQIYLCPKSLAHNILTAKLRRGQLVLCKELSIEV